MVAMETTVKGYWPSIIYMIGVREIKIACLAAIFFFRLKMV